MEEYSSERKKRELANLPKFEKDILKACQIIDASDASRKELLDACKAQEEVDNWYGSSSTGRKLKDRAKELRQAAIAKTNLI